jgi:HK97 family phage portal protein
MGWLDKFFPKKPQEKILTEEIVKSSSNWAQVFQAAAEFNISGDKVSKPYEQVVNVYKAVKAIADNVPQAELVFKNFKTEEEVYPEDLISLFDNPNPLMTRNEFIQATAGYLALYGECAIIKSRSVGQMLGTRKLPAELWPINPDKISMETSGNAVTSYKYNGTTFQPDEVLFIKDFNPSSIFRGLAPTKVLSKIIEIDWSSLVYSKAFFENDATPGFMLTTDKPLTEVQRTRLNEWINKSHKGASKAFRSVILDNGVTPKTVGSSAKDSELMEQRNYVREEILGVWRAPKALFNITDSLNYATFMGQMKIFWLYGIEPILGKLSDAFNKGIITPAYPAIYCEFDVSQVAAFQEDFKEKVTTAKQLVDMGFTANEVNEKMKLGFEPKEWRDVAWINSSMVPADPEGAKLAAEISAEAAANPPAPVQAPKKDEKGFEQSARLWKGFVSRHEKIEMKFDKKIRTYFFNQRKEVLAHIGANVPKAYHAKGFGFDGIDWQGQDDALKKMSSIFLMNAIQAGADYGAAIAEQGEVNAQIGAKQDMLLQELTARITRVNRTIRRNLQDRANEALHDGLAQGLTMDQIGENVKDSVRGFYNMIDSRAKMIARTEVTSAMNGGSLLYYKAIGATGKIWITANDEVVRETHRACQDQGEIGIDQVFDANSMQAPGMGSEPGEVINCRCSLKPTFK